MARRTHLAGVSVAASSGSVWIGAPLRGYRRRMNYGRARVGLVGTLLCGAIVSCSPRHDDNSQPATAPAAVTQEDRQADRVLYAATITKQADGALRFRADGTVLSVSLGKVTCTRKRLLGVRTSLEPNFSRYGFTEARCSDPSDVSFNDFIVEAGIDRGFVGPDAPKPSKQDMRDVFTDAVTELMLQGGRQVVVSADGTTAVFDAQESDCQDLLGTVQTELRDTLRAFGFTRLRCGDRTVKVR